MRRARSPRAERAAGVDFALDNRADGDGIHRRRRRDARGNVNRRLGPRTARLGGAAFRRRRHGAMRLLRADGCRGAVLGLRMLRHVGVRAQRVCAALHLALCRRSALLARGRERLHARERRRVEVGPIRPYARALVQHGLEERLAAVVVGLLGKAKLARVLDVQRECGRHALAQLHERRGRFRGADLLMLLPARARLDALPR
mmetsp:Transcript_10082/g.31827  ORF Transcript_10082/g.31827 Transcript_10082/m.31827 type:complete len:202 (+) Transcript_10082:464-1069(+)